MASANVLWSAALLSVRSAAASFVVLLPACQQIQVIGDGTSGECVPADVQAAFDRSCGGPSCHTDGGVAGGLALGGGQAAAAIGRPAMGSPLPLVEIGDTSGSYLAQKLMADPSTSVTGERMPVGFQPSNANQVADVNTILGWIAGGEFPDCVAADTGTADTGTADTGTISNGLPCDVEDVLSTYCRGCHGDPPIGTTFSLSTRDDLLAPAPSDATKTVGEQCVARLGDDTLPMPPSPLVRPSADEIAAIADWVAAGMPEGDCMPGYDPFAVDPVCTSQRTWTGGNEEDPRMRPGLACNECHRSSGEGPILVVAGTVYPTGHEPDNCYGVPEVTVHLTDANDRVVQLRTNSSGNFLLDGDDAPAGFAPPFTVKVVSDVGEKVMPIPSEHGDCNVCHTQNGEQTALGRIVAPW